MPIKSSRGGGAFQYAFVFTISLFILVIPEGCSRESVVAVVVVLLLNNRSPTETFGNDKRCMAFCCFFDWLLRALKGPYKRVFLSGSKKGLTRFFFLIQYHYGPGRVI